MAAVPNVWVRLVQNGTPSELTKLKFNSGDFDVDDVKEAAKLKFAAKLQGLDANDLEVRATNDGPALRPSQAPTDAAQQDDNPLFIVDPRPVTTSGSTSELFTVWSILISSSKIFIFRNAWPALL
jgi:hypothetical protein